MTFAKLALRQRRGVASCAGSARARAACSSARSSLRTLVRSQPLCTKVSLPSGRTSEIVTWRSTLGRRRADPRLERAGADDRVFGGERRGDVGQRVPARALRPVVGGRRGPQPARAAAGVAGEVGRRPRRRVPGEASAPAVGRRRVGAARRRRPRYHERAARRRAAGSARTSARSRAPARPARAAGAVVEQDPYRRQRLERGERGVVARAAPGSGRRAASTPATPITALKIAGASAFGRRRELRRRGARRRARGSRTSG